MNPGLDANSEELAKVVLARFGLVPRKNDAKAGFHKLLIELYEAKKLALKEKRPEYAILPVETMALHAGIARQTMYDHLSRWKQLQIIKKTSVVRNSEVIIGYELNGNNLEAAFRRAESIINGHIERSIEVIQDLQNTIKKEKLKSKR